MLSHVEVTARVELTEAAHFWWVNRLEYSHDCFVCRRTGRTVLLHQGAAHGLCHSSQRSLEWQDDLELVGNHPAPIRITGFGSSGGGSGDTLRCRLSFWWSPFTDLKRPEERGSELPAKSWVRLFYRVGCHACRDAGEDQWFNGEQSLQTNAVWPVATPCRKCGADLVTMTGPPEITLVG